MIKNPQNNKIADRIYILFIDKTINGIFLDFPKAYAALKKYKEYISNRHGVDIIVSSDTEFIFLIGWEDIRVRSYIKEYPLNTYFSTLGRIK